MIVIDKDATQVLSFRFSIFRKDGKYIQVIEVFGDGFPPTAKVFNSMQEACDDFVEIMKGYSESIPEIEKMTPEKYQAMEDNVEKIKEEYKKAVIEEHKNRMDSGKIDINILGKKKDKVLN